MLSILHSRFFGIAKPIANRLNLLTEDVSTQPHHPKIAPGWLIPVRRLPLQLVVQWMLWPEWMHIENLVVDLSNPGRTDLRDRPPRNPRILASHEQHEDSLCGVTLNEEFMEILIDLAIQRDSRNLFVAVGVEDIFCRDTIENQHLIDDVRQRLVRASLTNQNSLLLRIDESL